MQFIHYKPLFIWTSWRSHPTIWNVNSIAHLNVCSLKLSPIGKQTSLHRKEIHKTSILRLIAVGCTANDQLWTFPNRDLHRCLEMEIYSAIAEAEFTWSWYISMCSADNIIVGGYRFSHFHTLMCNKRTIMMQQHPPFGFGIALYASYGGLPK